MQPVSIKNNQYSNTLWLTQACLCLLILVILGLGVTINQWLLILLPLVLLALLFNHRTIAQQSNLQFAMRSTGQLVLLEQAVGQLSIENYQSVINQDEMTVSIKVFWYLPPVLSLKIKLQQAQQPVYLTLFRSVVGAEDFSQLLVGLTQMNTTPQKS
ncbi:hypothetical protein MNBD_GAMMA02-160 [hydrothermal vent metagenome]|uniref:Uncharacterized protein n=1 Tax=hydrothermal vent metagenome TaxID=652676 RepID=A0A3B0W5A6_9ZZZZ